jgi:hypothetical protein
MTSTYVILYKTNGGLLDNYEYIEGKTGVDALTNYLPDHMVGVIKKSTQREINSGNISFILQKYVDIEGIKYARGHKTCYTYHKPYIEKLKMKVK